MSSGRDALTIVRVQRWSLWSGPVFLAVFFGGILCAGWLPPMRANLSAQQVASIYADHTDRIRLGAVLIGMSGPFQGIWSALMSCQLRRIERDRPLLTYLQLVAGGVGILVVVIPAFVFGAAAFEPGRDPEITKALNDLGWLTMVGIGWPTVLQCLAVAGAVLTDHSEDPVFPRWFGWFNLWAILGLIPGPFLLFFHTGPFAWNGAATFWLPATVFGVWFAVWFVVLRRAIADEESELMSFSISAHGNAAVAP
ncbi:MAG: hypothetical protein M3P04_08930 [Actinomycetota bacterium]|nr:hypothetical protein [Actinomycetota bacterium]